MYVELSGEPLWHRHACDRRADALRLRVDPDARLVVARAGERRNLTLVRQLERFDVLGEVGLQPLQVLGARRDERRRGFVGELDEGEGAC